jgi:hypothetical protein
MLSHPLGQLLLTPLSFFLCSGILYLLARAAGGQGSFLAQSYTTLLFGVPLTLLADILAPLCGVTPFAGPILFAAGVSWPLAIYLLIPQIQILMAVHALNWGKAAGVVVLTLLGALLISSVPGGSLLLGLGSF